MRDFVQYHNPDKRGVFRPSRRNYRIITDKTVDKLVGDRVWLVSRRGSPPEYILCETFVVERVGQRGRLGRLQNFAEASHGTPFDPPVRIDHEPWFGRLRKLTGNFAFGLQAIRNDEVLRGLVKVGTKP